MILMYHNIAETGGFNTLSASFFRDHIHWLKKAGYAIISLDQYIVNLKNNSPIKAVCLTFDDAYTCMKDIVFPFIKEENVPFAIFIPVNHVGKYNSWDVKNGHEKIGIMDWDDILELATKPLVTIGSHGCDHISLGNVGTETLHKEIIDSKKILEQKTGKTVNYFSYPFGQLKDMSVAADQQIRKAGYTAALSTIWGRKNKTDDIFRLKRIEINSFDDANVLKEKMESTIDLKHWKQKLKNSLYKSGILK